MLAITTIIKLASKLAKENKSFEQIDFTNFRKQFLEYTKVKSTFAILSDLTDANISIAELENFTRNIFINTDSFTLESQQDYTEAVISFFKSIFKYLSSFEYISYINNDVALI